MTGSFEIDEKKDDEQFEDVIVQGSHKLGCIETGKRGLFLKEIHFLLVDI